MSTLEKKRDEINRKRRISRSKINGKYAEYSAHYRRECLEKSKASQAAHRAIKSGKIARPNNCEKCKKKCKPDAHHESYKKEDWLNVIFLCRSCHRLRHVELNNQI